jgi:hypothetical protein
MTKKVHHMVLLKFKPNTPPAKIAGLFVELGRLQPQMTGMEHFGGGPYASPEGLNQGFTHGFLMTFADADARNQYLSHPEHERIKSEFLPTVADLIAFDFEEAT